MSELQFDTLQGTSNKIRVTHPNALYSPGHIIQTQFSVSEGRFYYRVPSPNSGMRGSSYAQGSNQGGTILRPVDVTIRPKSVNSYIHIEFCLFYEAHQDINFNILRDGSLLGAQYYGDGDVNQGRWVGLGVAYYDNNEDSTPMHMALNWIDKPGTTGPVTYSAAVIASNDTNRSMTLNSTYGNYLNGSNSFEQGVSFGIAQEIAG